MLSATPVNNRFIDLKTNWPWHMRAMKTSDRKLNTKSSIDVIFRRAQTAFNAWSKLEAQQRTTENLLNMLDFDFFELLDSVTIARSRKHIQRYYDTVEIGTFPERKKPLSIRCGLTTLQDAIDYNEIYNLLSSLNLGIYTPSNYILASKVEKYEAMYGRDMGNTFFKQSDREYGIMVLMRINLQEVGELGICVQIDYWTCPGIDRKL